AHRGHAAVEHSVLHRRGADRAARLQECERAGRARPAAGVESRQRLCREAPARPAERQQGHVRVRGRLSLRCESGEGRPGHPPGVVHGAGGAHDRRLLVPGTDHEPEDGRGSLHGAEAPRRESRRQAGRRAAGPGAAGSRHQAGQRHGRRPGAAGSAAREAGPGARSGRETEARAATGDTAVKRGFARAGLVAATACLSLAACKTLPPAVSTALVSFGQDVLAAAAQNFAPQYSSSLQDLFFAMAEGATGMPFTQAPAGADPYAQDGYYDGNAGYDGAYADGQYGAPYPDYGQPPYAQDPYPQDPYASEPYAQAPYAQAPYAQDPY